MSKYLMILKPLYFVAALALASFFVTLPAAPSALAQGDSWCEQNYPEDPHCHDDLRRSEADACDQWGCYTAVEICCIPDFPPGG
jgi:hypothetical protein